MIFFLSKLCYLCYNIEVEQNGDWIAQTVIWPITTPWITQDFKNSTAMVLPLLDERFKNVIIWLLFSYVLQWIVGTAKSGTIPDKDQKHDQEKQDPFCFPYHIFLFHVAVAAGMKR